MYQTNPRVSKTYNPQTESKIADCTQIDIALKKFFLKRLLGHVCSSHWPALVDVVHSQRAHTKDEQHSYKHVVDGPDVADHKQLTGKETVGKYSTFILLISTSKHVCQNTRFYTLSVQRHNW